MQKDLDNVIRKLLLLADNAQQDIDSLDNITTIEELSSRGIFIQDIEEQIDCLTYYITANSVLRDKLEKLSNKIIEKKLVVLH
tara:strand:+ start:1013 stop:1261 length:249 start_codon:yes stop_codon:yes gene_type:complete